MSRIWALISLVLAIIVAAQFLTTKLLEVQLVSLETEKLRCMVALTYCEVGETPSYGDDSHEEQECHGFGQKL